MSSPLLRRVEADALTGSPAAAIPEEVRAGAARIVAEVTAGGDAALRRLAGRLDGLGPGAPLVHPRPALAAALAARPAAEADLLRRLADRIAAFAAAQRRALADVDVPVPGGRAGHRVQPVAAAGCYAPGGRFPLPSSVLMTAVTARAAGVQRVVVACPRPQPVVLAAAAVAGADMVLAAGGAQAIAALAAGTESVPACDVVVGPGNVWVTAAKLLVAARCRTDGAAGPSELVVVADAASDPELVAADLLAQAEHDPLARPVLVALADGVIPAVEEALARQLVDLPTAGTARRALAGGAAVRVAGRAAAVALCNRLAPEHLQWNADGGAEPAGLTSYGGLFLGADAAEVLGDYGAGPNHVLPTGGAAHGRGGLWVGDFLAVRTWLRVDDPEAARPLAADARDLAALEGLEAHRRAAARRADRGRARRLPGRGSREYHGRDMANVQIEHLPDRDLTVLLLQGEVEAPDIIGALARVYELGPTRDLVWDFSGADVAALRADELRTILSESRRRSPGRPGGRTVVVAPGDLAFGMSRMYEGLADASGHSAIAYRVVRSRAEADAWLAAGA